MLAAIASTLVSQLTFFTIKNDDKDPSLILTTLTHPGTYIGNIGMIFAVCMGVYSFKRVLTLFPSLFMTYHSG